MFVVSENVARRLTFFDIVNPVAVALELYSRVADTLA
jgi:hypothetical protein